MAWKRGISVLLLLYVKLSHQICHNGICDEDKCTDDSLCPTCYSCDTSCGVCGPLDNCCTTHQNCDNWNGVCDAEENPTTCNYCDMTESQCKPGCITNDNCEAGQACQGHQCKPVETCPDDAFCNNGVSGECDIQNSPYTTCFYCEGGECLPGCIDADNCPGGYACTDHMCRAPEGKVLIESINIQTKAGCSDCANEGVVLSLNGETNGNYPNGVPCGTGVLNHASTTDFDGGWARFDGTLSGGPDEDEIGMMAGCYEAPLNARLNGGQLLWQGAAGWQPKKVCVDWKSSNFAYECTLTPNGANNWNLVNCHDLTPQIKCDL